MKAKDNGVRYLIHRKETGGWWRDTPSGVGVWVDNEHATKFSFLNTDIPSLPNGGEWVEISLEAGLKS
jgi:hypothetical protein